MLPDGHADSACNTSIKDCNAYHASCTGGNVAVQPEHPRCSLALPASALLLLVLSIIGSAALLCLLLQAPDSHEIVASSRLACTVISNAQQTADCNSYMMFSSQGTRHLCPAGGRSQTAKKGSTAPADPQLWQPH